MENLDIFNGGLRQDNTDGYSDNELHAINIELDARLSGIDTYSDDYYAACSDFSDQLGQL